MATKKNYETNGSTYYRIRRKVEMADGSTKTKAFYGTSKSDAEHQYNAFVKEQAEERFRTVLKHDNATFEQRADEYVKNALSVSQRLSSATIDRYSTSYRVHIKGTDFAQKKISSIKASDIQSFYNSLDVSMSTIKGIHRFMSSFYKWLVLNDYATDVLSAVEIPRKKDTTRHDGIVTWEEEEIQTILECLNAPAGFSERHRLSFFVPLLLYSGARIGEAIALKYGDIYDDTIHITRQCHMSEIKPPKYNSKRDIPFHSELIKPYQAHIEWHQYDMEKNNYETEYIFTTSKGNIYDPRNIRRALARMYNSLDIPYKHPHAYRATFCTQMCRCGVPLEVASELMGHKSIEVTAAHYALVKKDSKINAINLLSYNRP